MSYRRKHFSDSQSAATAPTLRTEGGRTIEEHPAYGQIMVNSTSGATALYGSDFPHQNYVSIEIHESVLNRDLSRDWPYARRELIRIEMTEAQFAAMVASRGRGEGTQCTIRRKMEGGRYVSVPELKLRTTADLYHNEGRERVARVLTQLDELKESVSSDLSGLSQKKREAILSRIESARREIGPNLDFVADSFVESLEEREERAKTEIHAWMASTVQRAGLTALGIEPPISVDGDIPLLPAPHPDEADEDDIRHESFDDQ